MTREIDKRNLSKAKIGPTREEELISRAAEVSDRLPGAHRVKISGFDSATKNPRAVRSEAAPAGRGDYVQRALDYLQSIKSVLGFAATQPAEYVADRPPLTTSTGAVAVRVQQQYKGIPIFQATETVRFAPDGSVSGTGGSSVTVGKDVSATPTLSVQDAVKTAANYVSTPQPDERGETDQFGQPMRVSSVDVSNFIPELRTSFADKPNKPAVFAPGPFAKEITASLVWMPLGADLRLAWQVILSLPEHPDEYETLVDAKTGEILYCQQLTTFVRADANVCWPDGGSPYELRNFPPKLEGYGLHIGGDVGVDSLPHDWVALDETAGNCVRSYLATTPPASPTPAGTTLRGERLQDGSVVFTPWSGPQDCDRIHEGWMIRAARLKELKKKVGYPNCSPEDKQRVEDEQRAIEDQKKLEKECRASNYPEQWVLNAFYFASYMHDYTYLLGFREADGNFQDDNFVFGGQGGDHVDAYLYDAELIGTAYMCDPGGDGQVGRMELGVVKDPTTGKRRHTALDAGVVFHEYTHGMTKRLIVLPGPRNNQCRAMGEGWSDFFACTILKTTVLGCWLVNNPNGIRTHPYDDSYPGTFADLGTGIYTEEHNVGEIWCATLMRMSRALGGTLGLQLVMDAIKLTSDSPNFLDGRDAILEAERNAAASGILDPDAHARAKDAIWEAFAHFGMGYAAGANGVQYTGNAADFSTPPK